MFFPLHSKGFQVLLHHSDMWLHVFFQVLQQLLTLGASVARRTHQGWTGAHVCAIRGCAICLQVRIASSVRVSLLKPLCMRNLKGQIQKFQGRAGRS